MPVLVSSRASGIISLCSRRISSQLSDSEFSVWAMDGKLHVRGHFNGLKTTLLFALMWAIIMLIWWATGGGRGTLGVYIVIGLVSTFSTYWFSDKLAIARWAPARHRAGSSRTVPHRARTQRQAGKPMPRIYVAPTMSPNAFATAATSAMQPYAARKVSSTYSTSARFAVSSATSLCTCTTTTSSPPP